MTWGVLPPAETPVPSHAQMHPMPRNSWMEAGSAIPTPMTIGSMTRRGLALLLLFTATGAGPAPSLPLPPVLPEHPRTDQTAPIPNPDARGPRDAASIGTEVQVTDFRASRQNQSLGYSPGSQFQTGEDRRSIQTPGLTVRVPLW